jgi:hypothetical protein
MLRTSFASISVGMLASTAPILAQAPARQAQHPADFEENDILVIGGKPEGSVLGDIAPEVSFNPGDIRSFGVSSLSDLIAELAPQTTSGQGRGGESPVVLLNGKRISSFAEVRDIPTEAIQRVDILPEEVALKYGYRPNQKVVNVVLRRRFKAFVGEVEAAAPTSGGQFSPEFDSSYLGIAGSTRINFALKYERSSALYESERDITAQSPRQPYDLLGNITSARSGAEIDPALSALLGRSATVVGLPASAAQGRPSLADFTPGAVNQSDVGAYRTLLPQTDAVTANAVLARTIFGNVSASFNGTLTYNESDSAQGLGTARLTVPADSPYSPFASDTLLYRYLGEFDPLRQQSRNISGHLGTTFNGSLSSWNWTLTGNFDHASSRTDAGRGYGLSGLQSRIDTLDLTLNPFTPLGIDQIDGRLVDHARSNSDVGDAQFMVSGSPFSLPAGAATTTLNIGGTTSSFRARSIRSSVISVADLSREELQGQISVDFPIASRKHGFLSPLGELTANLNLERNDNSDVGGLNGFGVGLNWTPVKPVSFVFSLNRDEGAPTVQQLGNPTISTSGIRVFDYVRGETVDITRLSGGNRGLTADDRRVLKLGMTLKPFAKLDLRLTANYTDSRIHDPITAFPTATAAIEAAFPDRFTRDASGRLVQIDSRPINFARQDSRDIRWGINFSKQLSTPPRPAGGVRAGQQPSLRELLPPGQNEPAPTGQRDGANRPGGGFGGPPGGGFGRGPGGRGTRLQLAAYHTVHLREQILVYDGGPVLDLLKGDAIGSSGGQPRHEIQAQAGLTHNGFGSRLSFSWESSTTVDGGANGAQALRFSDLSTLNLRLFASLGQQQKLTSKWPFLRGSRLSLSVTNLFDAHQRVRDLSGNTPISYQPDYLDPLGRSIQISFRKLFF